MPESEARPARRQAKPCVEASRLPHPGNAAHRRPSPGGEGKGLADQLQALEVALRGPFRQQGIELVDAGREGLAVEAAGALAALVVVVAGRAGDLEVAVGDRELADGLDPGFLRLGRG